MKCRIDTTKLNPHIKEAVKNAKVDGIYGEIIHFEPETNCVTVLFTYDGDGNERNQIFPFDANNVLVEVDKPLRV